MSSTIPALIERKVLSKELAKVNCWLSWLMSDWRSVIFMVDPNGGSTIPPESWTFCVGVKES